MAEGLIFTQRRVRNRNLRGPVKFRSDSGSRMVEGWVSARRGGLEVQILLTLIDLETRNGQLWWRDAIPWASGQ